MLKYGLKGQKKTFIGDKPLKNKMENIVLESTKFVVDNSRYVKINMNKIEEFCNDFGESHINHWINESPFNLNKLSEKEKLHFLLVFNSISFSYWGQPKWEVEYKGEKFDGAFGMITSIGKAIENKKPILDPKYLKEISEKELKEMLKGNIIIPLFEDRLKILKEAGAILIRDFNGDFGNLIKKANRDALKLLSLILNHFPYFNDSSLYKGKTIYFRKRAQLLISDIYQLFSGKNYGNLKNFDKITACADYKLPMVLRKLGILKYSKELAERIDKKIEIIKNSVEEVEIRANTIWAVEFIRQKLNKKNSMINSVHINDHLWLIGQIKSQKDKPYHLTRTIAY